MKKTSIIAIAIALAFFTMTSCKNPNSHPSISSKDSLEASMDSTTLELESDIQDTVSY
jgi:PBP1b-binding outer membrane lipoprotein LpoB